MSDQPKPAEIEDVLSSIRRLVAGGDAARAAPPGPPASEVEEPDAGGLDDTRPDDARRDHAGPEDAKPEDEGDDAGTDLTAGPEPAGASASPGGRDALAGASHEVGAAAPGRDGAGLPDDPEAAADAAWSAAAGSAATEAGDSDLAASQGLSGGATGAADASVAAAGAEGADGVAAEEARDDETEAGPSAPSPSTTESARPGGDAGELSPAGVETGFDAGRRPVPPEDVGDRDAASVDTSGGDGSDTAEASDERLSALVLTPALRIEPEGGAPGADSAGPAKDRPKGQPPHATSPVSPLLSRATQAGGPTSPRQGFGFGMGRTDEQASAATSSMISEDSDAHSAPGRNALPDRGHAAHDPARDAATPPTDHVEAEGGAGPADETGAAAGLDPSDAAPRRDPIISRDFARRSPFRSRPAPGAAPGAPAVSDTSGAARGGTTADGEPTMGEQTPAADKARLGAQSAAEAPAGQSRAAATAAPAPDDAASRDDPDGATMDGPGNDLPQTAADGVRADSAAFGDADTTSDDEGPLAPEGDTQIPAAAGQNADVDSLDGALPGQGTSTPGAVEPAESAARTDATGTAAPFNLFGDEDGVIDEAALRAMVADVVRDELKGALGERVSRNIRALVRREIARALTRGDIE